MNIEWWASIVGSFMSNFIVLFYTCVCMYISDLKHSLNQFYLWHNDNLGSFDCSIISIINCLMLYDKIRNFFPKVEMYIVNYIEILIYYI